jgi:hypothetical protein
MTVIRVVIHLVNHPSPTSMHNQEYCIAIGIFAILTHDTIQTTIYSFSGKITIVRTIQFLRFINKFDHRYLEGVNILCVERKIKNYAVASTADAS